MNGAKSSPHAPFRARGRESALARLRACEGGGGGTDKATSVSDTNMADSQQQQHGASATHTRRAPPPPLATRPERCHDAFFTLST